MKLAVTFGALVKPTPGLTHPAIVWKESYPKLTYWDKYEVNEQVLSQINDGEIVFIVDKNVVESRGMNMVKVLGPWGIGYVDYDFIVEVDS